MAASAKFIASTRALQRNMSPGLETTEMATGLSPALDWDMWLGPAPVRALRLLPVHLQLPMVLGLFRWPDDELGRAITWILPGGSRGPWKRPPKVSGFGGRYSLTDGGETPDVQQVTYQFPEDGHYLDCQRSHQQGKTSDARHLRHEGYADAIAKRLSRWPPGDEGNWAPARKRLPLMEALQVKGNDPERGSTRGISWTA